MVDLIPTELRLNKVYIIGYINWTWTAATVLIPFGILLYLSTRIFNGLRQVKKNLNRHKRLETKAVAAIHGKKETTCTIQVKVTNENGIGKWNLRVKYFGWLREPETSTRVN